LYSDKIQENEMGGTCRCRKVLILSSKLEVDGEVTLQYIFNGVQGMNYNWLRKVQ
jgi:hypothetical protein